MEKSPEKLNNTPKRITWGLIWGDVLNVINFEKGVFFTIKGLFLHPKQTVDDYLYGNRSLHANPLRFLIFSTAIFTLLNIYLVIKPSMDQGAFNQTDQGYMYDLGKEMGGSVNHSLTNDSSNTIITDSVIADTVNVSIKKAVNTTTNKEFSKEREARVLKESMDNLFNWMDKFTFAMVPIFALFTFLFFKNSGYNYTENLVNSAYMTSVTNVIGIVLIAPSYLWPVTGGIVVMLFTFGYMIYFIYTVFAIKGASGFFKSVMTFFLSYFLFLLLIGGAFIYFILDSITQA